MGSKAKRYAMNRDDKIRTALERSRRAIELRPAMATGTVSLRLEMGKTIKCTTQSDGWTLEIDEPSSMGGEGSAPGPYVHGFSAIASCFAMSIRMLAIQAGIKVDSITVDLEGDYDDRAFFDLADVAPGYQNIRMKVDVSSDVGDHQIEELVAEARRKSTWFNTFANQSAIETRCVCNGESV
jgi:uncharacterized OsmC-like protein